MERLPKGDGRWAIVEAALDAARFRADPMMRQLFERTFRHPDLGWRTDLVSVEWLLGLANPVADSCAGDLSKDESVSADDLFRSLLAEGMCDPLIISVGRLSRTIRLEAGYHRIRALHERGVLWAPATAYVDDLSMTTKGDGAQPGRCADLHFPMYPNVMRRYPEMIYTRPQNVIVDCPALPFTGW